MAKKSNLITGLIVAAAVAGGIYFINKRRQSKSTDSDLEAEPGAAEQVEAGEKETAQVTAKTKNDIYDAIEKAQEIAANTKDAVVTVKDAADNIIAEVTSGEASDPSKKEARKARRAQRKAGRKARRAERKTKRRARRSRRRRK